MNIFLILSCVLLGWHYVIDVIAGIALLTLGSYCLWHSRLLIEEQEKPSTSGYRG
jgi:hypothetical protein